MTAGVAGCLDQDGDLLPLYRDAALYAGWTPGGPGAVIAALEDAADEIQNAALYVMGSDVDSAAGAAITAAILERAESIVRLKADGYRDTP